MQTLLLVIGLASALILGDFIHAGQIFTAVTHLSYSPALPVGAALALGYTVIEHQRKTPA